MWQGERARPLGARAAPFCASGRAQNERFSFFIFGVVRRAADAHRRVDAPLAPADDVTSCVHGLHSSSGGGDPNGPDLGAVSEAGKDR